MIHRQLVNVHRIFPSDEATSQTIVLPAVFSTGIRLDIVN
jgi:hypothetical protein